MGIADSSAWVYGWRGVRVQRVAVGDLDDPAEVHHGDPVADVLHHARLWAMNSSVRLSSLWSSLRG